MASDLKTSLTADTSAITDLQQADAADVTTPIADLLDLIRSGRVGVSANATHIGHLIDVLTATSPVTLTENNDGGNETLTVALNAALTAFAANVNGSGAVDLAALDTGAAANGTSIIADGSGGATTGTAGSINPADRDAVAGEALAEGDAVAMNPSDGEWYKIDIDATSGNGMPYPARGVVVESGGIAAAATGKVRIFGAITGLSGLSAGSLVYVSDTPGGITTTRPSVNTGDPQKAIVVIGYADSSSSFVLERHPVRYVQRASVANGVAITITTPAETVPYMRRVRPYRIVSGNWLNGIYATADLTESSAEVPAFIDSDTVVNCQNRTGGTVEIACIVEMD